MNPDEIYAVQQLVSDADIPPDQPHQAVGYDSSGKLLGINFANQALLAQWLGSYAAQGALINSVVHCAKLGAFRRTIRK